MTPYLVTARALEIASLYWFRPWWELSAAEIQEALDWWYGPLGREGVMGKR